jgi:outer membrane protein
MEEKMKKLLLVAGLLMLSIIMTSGVQAQTKVAAGLGVGAAPEFEGSDDYEGVPLLFLNAKWDNHMSVSIMGNAIRANLMPHPVLRAGLAGEFIGERDDVDNRAVNLLEDVDSSFMAGGFLGFEKNRWNASVELMKDVADGNDGSIVRFKGGYGMPINQAMSLNMGVFTTWADDDYMDAYFTVTAAGHLASGLNAYKAESGIKDVGASFSLHYTPWQNWGIMGLLTYKKLLGDAEDSPIVDIEGDAGQAVIGAMLTYRF